VIVRIATEGQYRLEDGAGQRLNELDNAVVEAVETGDGAAFAAAYRALLDLARSGEALAEDELASSALILPPPDLTLAEAGEHFSGDGLLPD
jgi:hypothetical protein